MDNKTEYKVLSFQKQQTKNGKEMWRIGMINPKDEKPLTGVIWEEDIPRFDGKKFKAGNIIKFLGQDYNSNYNSVVVKNVTVVKEALDGLPENIRNKYIADFDRTLFEIEQKYSKAPTLEDPKTQLPYALLASEMRKMIKRPEFLTTPAAERFHHNYIGGLVKHTYEVLHIVMTLAEMYTIENIDGLKLAAILHDMGKMYEYDVDKELGIATINQEWLKTDISHLHWAFRFAHDCAAFDVGRMVASHHGRVEWGALFEPETPEEKVLHLADMISATIGVINTDKLAAMLEQMKANNILEQAQEATKQEKEEVSNVRKTSSDIL